MLARENPQLLVNCLCPGYCKTGTKCSVYLVRVNFVEMGGENAVLTPSDGAETPVFLTLDDLNGETGQFFTLKKNVGFTGTSVG